MTGDLWRGIILAILFVIGTGVVGLLLIQARGKLRFGAAPRRLHLIERLSLGDRQFVTLIRCDEREHLIVNGKDGVKVIDSQSRAETVLASGLATAGSGAIQQSGLLRAARQLFTTALTVAGRRAAVRE